MLNFGGVYQQVAQIKKYTHTPKLTGKQKIEKATMNEDVSPNKNGDFPLP